MIVSTAAAIPSQTGEEAFVGSVLGRLLVESDLVVGVVTALLVMAVPVLHLTAQAVRVGAPARDRRLQGIRSAGGTRDDVRRVVRAEATVWSCLGAGLGVVAFYVFMLTAPGLLRVEYADLGPGVGTSGADMVTGTLPVISLVAWPHPLLIAAAAALVPAVAALMLPLATRRVVDGPWAPAERPMSRGLALATLGSAVLAVAAVLGLAVGLPDVLMVYEVVNAVAVLAVATLLVCLLTSSAVWVAGRLGRALAGRERAGALIAGRLMQAHPHLASRTASSLVLVALVGGIAIPLGAVIESEVVGNARANGWDAVATDGRPTTELLFYSVPVMAVQALVVVAAVLGAIGLVIAVAEQVSMRGPQLVQQVAAGVPRRVLRRALVVEAAAPAAIMSTIALLVGAALVLVPASLTGGGPGSVPWERFAGLWVLLVGGSFVAAWLGGAALSGRSAPERLRDRE